jgi:hypothetical protein
MEEPPRLLTDVNIQTHVNDNGSSCLPDGQVISLLRAFRKGPRYYTSNVSRLKPHAPNLPILSFPDITDKNSQCIMEFTIAATIIKQCMETRLTHKNPLYQQQLQKFNQFIENEDLLATIEDLGLDPKKKYRGRNKKLVAVDYVLRHGESAKSRSMQEALTNINAKIKQNRKEYLHWFLKNKPHELYFWIVLHLKDIDLNF